MPHTLPTPITYLITSGETTEATTPSSEDFQRVLALVEAAVAAGITLVQLREKRLRTRMLYELAARAAALTRADNTITTRLLVNDRADVAFAAGCDGVHLTTQSLAPFVIRRAFGDDFLIGASTHSVTEARRARDEGADFAVFGPVFDTASKSAYGLPVGLDAFDDAARSLSPFPLVALGGITSENIRDVFKAGAKGIAAIRLFAEAENLQRTVRDIQKVWRESYEKNEVVRARVYNLE